jgi:hypothetical protein
MRTNDTTSWNPIRFKVKVEETHTPKVKSSVAES